MQRVLCLIGLHKWRYERAVNEKNPSGWRCQHCPRFRED